MAYTQLMSSIFHAAGDKSVGSVLRHQQAGAKQPKQPIELVGESVVDSVFYR